MKKISYRGRKSTKREFVLMLARWYSRELSLDKSSCTLVIVNSADLDFDPAGIDGATSRTGSEIMMYITPNISLPRMVEVVAHEMLHVRQYARGYLRTIIQGSVTQQYWMGRAVNPKLDYLDLPWEVQAFAQQGLLARRFSQAVERMQSPPN